MINDNFSRAISDYYAQLDRSTITQEEYSLWIDSLQEPMKKHFKGLGIEGCRGVLNFQRFILELRETPLDEFLQERLSPEDYRAYKEAELP